MKNGVGSRCAGWLWCSFGSNVVSWKRQLAAVCSESDAADFAVLFAVPAAAADSGMLGSLILGPALPLVPWGVREG